MTGHSRFKPPAPSFHIMNLAACCMVLFFMLGLTARHGFSQNPPETEPDINQLMQDTAYIYKFYPDNAAGKGYGYKLVYMVAASLSVKNRT